MCASIIHVRKLIALYHHHNKVEPKDHCVAKCTQDYITWGLIQDSNTRVRNPKAHLLSFSLALFLQYLSISFITGIQVKQTSDPDRKNISYTHPFIYF